MSSVYDVFEGTDTTTNNKKYFEDQDQFMMYFKKIIERLEKLGG